MAIDRKWAIKGRCFRLVRRKFFSRYACSKKTSRKYAMIDLQFSERIIVPCVHGDVESRANRIGVANRSSSIASILSSSIAIDAFFRKKRCTNSVLDERSGGVDVRGGSDGRCSNRSSSETLGNYSRNFLRPPSARLSGI